MESQNDETGHRGQNISIQIEEFKEEDPSADQVSENRKEPLQPRKNLSKIKLGGNVAQVKNAKGLIERSSLLTLTEISEGPSSEMSAIAPADLTRAQKQQISIERQDQIQKSDQDGIIKVGSGCSESLKIPSSHSKQNLRFKKQANNFALLVRNSDAFAQNNQIFSTCQQFFSKILLSRNYSSLQKLINWTHGIYQTIISTHYINCLLQFIKSKQMKRSLLNMAKQVQSSSKQAMQFVTSQYNNIESLQQFLVVYQMIFLILVMILTDRAPDTDASFQNLVWHLIKNLCCIYVIYNQGFQTKSYKTMLTQLNGYGKIAASLCVPQTLNILFTFLAFQSMFSLLKDRNCKAVNCSYFFSGLRAFHISFQMIWITLDWKDNGARFNLQRTIIVCVSQLGLAWAYYLTFDLTGIVNTLFGLVVSILFQHLLFIGLKWTIVQAQETFLSRQKQAQKSKKYHRQLNKNYFVVKLTSDRVTRRRIEMRVIEMSTDIQINMPGVKADPLADERLNASSQFNLTISKRAPLILITGLSRDIDINFLQESIFVPYLVSNSMKVKYENRREQQFSIKQIILDQTSQNENGGIMLSNRRTLLYFRVPKQIIQKKSRSTQILPLNDEQSSQQAESNKLSSEQNHQNVPANIFRSSLTQDDDIIDRRPLRTNSSPEQIKEKQDLDNLPEHLSTSDLKKIFASNSLENNYYFEFEMYVYNSDDWKQESGGEEILVSIRDISNIVICQRRISDKIYQDALVANYSHEQYTPLNNILTVSKLVEKSIDELINFQEERFGLQNKQQNDQTRIMIRSIEQSGRILKFFNDNQIQRMKIKKGEFHVKFVKTQQPENFIKHVIEPFQMQIENRQINVHIFKNFDLEKMYLHADWTKFKLVMFNLVQNSLKYNNNKGDVVFIMKLNKLSRKNDEMKAIESEKHESEDLKDFKLNKMLTIEIIDTGLGIDEERQQYLFVPFLELCEKQDINQVKNENIGLGLSCSFTIIQKLGGSLKLLESQKNNITVFQIEMPVWLDLRYLEEISLQSDLWSRFQHLMLFNFDRPLHSCVVDYIEYKIERKIYNVEDVAQLQVNYLRDNPNISMSGQICLNQSQDIFANDDEQSLVNRLHSEVSEDNNAMSVQDRNCSFRQDTDDHFRRTATLTEIEDNQLSVNNKFAPKRNQSNNSFIQVSRVRKPQNSSKEVSKIISQLRQKNTEMFNVAKYNKCARKQSVPENFFIDPQVFVNLMNASRPEIDQNQILEAQVDEECNQDSDIVHREIRNSIEVLRKSIKDESLRKSLQDVTDPNATNNEQISELQIENHQIRQSRDSQQQDQERKSNSRIAFHPRNRLSDFINDRILNPNVSKESQLSQSKSSVEVERKQYLEAKTLMKQSQSEKKLNQMSSQSDSVSDKSGKNNNQSSFQNYRIKQAEISTPKFIPTPLKEQVKQNQELRKEQDTINESFERFMCFKQNVKQEDPSQKRKLRLVLLGDESPNKKPIIDHLCSKFESDEKNKTLKVPLNGSYINVKIENWNSLQGQCKEMVERQDGFFALFDVQNRDSLKSTKNNIIQLRSLVEKPIMCLAHRFEQTSHEAIQENQHDHQTNDADLARLSRDFPVKVIKTCLRNPRLLDEAFLSLISLAAGQATLGKKDQLKSKKNDQDLQSQNDQEIANEITEDNDNDISRSKPKAQVNKENRRIQKKVNAAMFKSQNVKGEKKKKKKKKDKKSLRHEACKDDTLNNSMFLEELSSLSQISNKAEKCSFSQSKKKNDKTRDDQKDHASRKADQAHRLERKKQKLLTILVGESFQNRKLGKIKDQQVLTSDSVNGAKSDQSFDQKSCSQFYDNIDVNEDEISSGCISHHIDFHVKMIEHDQQKSESFIADNEEWIQIEGMKCFQELIQNKEPVSDENLESLLGNIRQIFNMKKEKQKSLNSQNFDRDMFRSVDCVFQQKQLSINDQDELCQFDQEDEINQSPQGQNNQSILSLSEQIDKNVRKNKSKMSQDRIQNHLKLSGIPEQIAQLEQSISFNIGDASNQSNQDKRIDFDKLRENQVILQKSPPKRQSKELHSQKSSRKHLNQRISQEKLRQSKPQQENQQELPIAAAYPPRMIDISDSPDSDSSVSGLNLSNIQQNENEKPEDKQVSQPLNDNQIEDRHQMQQSNKSFDEDDENFLYPIQNSKLMRGNRKYSYSVLRNQIDNNAQKQAVEKMLSMKASSSNSQHNDQWSQHSHMIQSSSVSDSDEFNKQNRRRTLDPVMIRQLSRKLSSNLLTDESKIKLTETINRLNHKMASRKRSCQIKYFCSDKQVNEKVKQKLKKQNSFQGTSREKIDLRMQPVDNSSISNDNQNDDSNKVNNVIKTLLQSHKVNEQIGILKEKESKNNACCKEQILLVDDNDFNLLSLKQLVVSLFNIEPISVCNGLEALNIFKETYNKKCGCPNRSFRIIFMDINMPVMDGYESSQKILSFLNDLGDPDYARIVAITSNYSEIVAQRCQSFGIKQCINKPLPYKKLQKMMYLHYYRIPEEQFNQQFPHLND